MSNSNDLNFSNDFSLFSGNEPTEKGGNSEQAIGGFLLNGQTSAFTNSASNSAGGFTNHSNTDFSSLDTSATYNEHYDTGPLRGESVQQRVERIRASKSPLLEAVQPLLRALSEIPVEINQTEQILLLRQVLKNEITLFSVVCDEAEISWKKMSIVRYCICTALDEAILSNSWSKQVAWSQNNLLNHFEGDNDGGNKFFLLLGRLSMSPKEYLDVLEVLLLILNLGFEGRYSIIENGDRQLNKIRQRLLVLLQTNRDAIPPALSPHAISAVVSKSGHHITIPARVSMVIGGLLTASIFIAYKYLLVVPESSMLKQMLELRRAPAVIPRPQPVRLRLAILLKNEIAQGIVSVDETTEVSKVIFRGDYMFKTGSDTPQPETLPILKRVADEVVRVNGNTLVVGYTDSVPIHSRLFPNNQVLSEKRAEKVAEILQQWGIQASKVSFEGRGSTLPIADNATKEGREKNRRVEIFVKY